MDTEFISRSLFRPFQTTKKKGLGIGMFQSKMIVEAHGGRIEVESGARQRRHFPRSPALAQFCSMNPKLLIVDDDEEIRTQMKWALAADYDIILAEDRPSAIEKFRAAGPSPFCLTWACPRIPATPKKASPPSPRFSPSIA